MSLVRIVVDRTCYRFIGGRSFPIQPGTYLMELSKAKEIMAQGAVVFVDEDGSTLDEAAAQEVRDTLADVETRRAARIAPPEPMSVEPAARVSFDAPASNTPEGKAFLAAMEPPPRGDGFPAKPRDIAPRRPPIEEG